MPDICPLGIVTRGWFNNIPTRMNNDTNVIPNFDFTFIIYRNYEEQTAEVPVNDV